MAKKTLNQRHTEVANDKEHGLRTEQTLIVEDNILPNPQELEAYKQIDPKIVDKLLEMSIKEQEHRHKSDMAKIDTIALAEKKRYRMNWWGMFFAFMALVILLSVAGLALYLNRPWFAGIFGFAAIGGIISVFTESGKQK